MNDPNVVVVVMGYMRPNTFETDYPTCEFLRKPVKEQAFVRCLREVWSKLDQSKNSMQRVSSGGSGGMQRVSSGGSGGGGLQRVSSNGLKKTPSNGLSQVREDLKMGQSLPMNILIAEGIFLLLFFYWLSIVIINHFFYRQ